MNDLELQGCSDEDYSHVLIKKDLICRASFAHPFNWFF